MQPVNNPPDSGKTSFQYGLIFGISLFVIATLLSALNTFALKGNTALNLIIVGFIWLLDLGAFFAVGVFAARKTALVKTATMAGLWMGIFDGVLSAIYGLIIFFSYSLKITEDAMSKASSTSSSTMTPATMHSFLVVGGIGGQVFAILFTIGIATGMAALGGLLGRKLSKVVRPGYGPAFYPGAPFQGQPYPGYPGPGQQPSPNQPYPGYPGQQPYMGQQPYPGYPEPQPQPEQQYSGLPFYSGENADTSIPATELSDKPANQSENEKN
ncbi:hypothetical protein [Dictyobacter arantiisoli]|uniref:Uncharacterized protein n=1 Tax=Dictyobacter arantiisoli TaxID=2014874 RepID=A0A5A5T6B5_9CHLR|nr:hypothetical protein [Dictyobacter arantiisoli]GCF06897.1 hypothetical protein KDI_04610 [Dictyobacter arantiisoli]